MINFFKDKIALFLSIMGIGLVWYYFTGNISSAFFVAVGIFFVGMSSLSHLISRIDSDVKDGAKNTADALFWYTGCFIEVIALAMVFGERTLIDIYNEWSIHHRTIYGFVRVFAPVVLLTVGAVWMAYDSSDRRWTRRLMKFGLVMGIVALIFHEPVQSWDWYASVFKHKVAEVTDVKTLSMKRHRGVFAIFIHDGHLYSRSNLDTFEKEDQVFKGKKFKVFNPKNIIESGPFEYVCVWGKYSPNRWVRLNDVKFVTHYRRQNRRRQEHKGHKKTYVFHKGKYVFNLLAGESTCWIDFPSGVITTYYIKSETPGDYIVHYSDGTIYSKAVDKKGNIVFYIEAINDQKIVLDVEKMRKKRR